MTQAPRSLQWRLLAGMGLWIFLSLVLTGLVLAGLFREHVESQLQADLRLELDRLTAGFEVRADGGPALSNPDADPRWRLPYSGRYWQLNAVGKPGLLRSRSLWDAVLRLPGDTLPDGEVHVHALQGPSGQSLLALERQVSDDGAPGRHWQLIVAADTAPFRGAVSRFIGLMAAALGILALALMLAAWVQLRIGLSPLRRLQQGLNRLRSGAVNRVTDVYPREIQPLIDDFNVVLEQKEQVLAQARTQAGNLAHALKTPLTILANAAHGQEGELAELVLEQVAVARRQVDWHLARARAAASAGSGGISTAVAPVAASLQRVMAKVHAGKSLDFGLSCPDSLCFAGEEHDLMEMLGNLLDNACKWAKGRVSIRATGESGQLTIRVADDGPGLPAETVDLVLQRGVRMDERIPGSGLGLAIVDELARLHGGGVKLAASEWGGVEAVLTLPAVTLGSSRS